jgi:hypothetical protein
MQSVLVIFVVVILASWAAATVALQLPWVRPRLRSSGFSILIPEYRFFAPVPAQGDFHLVFRDTYADGTVGRWTEVCRLQPRHFTDALFNPYKRERKAFFDCVISLSDYRPTEPKLLAVSTPYLLMLNYVRGLPRTLAVTHIEFGIVHSGGWCSPRSTDVVFVSGRHRRSTAA